ncbi:hypothetical protein J6590_106772, partial [Homalodisca vitripennis]
IKEANLYFFWECMMGCPCPSPSTSSWSLCLAMDSTRRLIFISHAVERSKVLRIKEANLYFFWECMMGCPCPSPSTSWSLCLAMDSTRRLIFIVIDVPTVSCSGLLQGIKDQGSQPVLLLGVYDGMSVSLTINIIMSRAVDRSKVSKIKEANLYFFWECMMGLSVSLTINIIVVSVFGHGLYQKTNADV